jgi:exopolyphosphatase/guanosine-5'-triphosphate,3'-diphosphate pyrophosphatase
MGCVSLFAAAFPNGRVDKRGLREAELAAQKEIQTITHAYREIGWEEAVGSSGSAKALVDILELNGCPTAASPAAAWSACAT